MATKASVAVVCERQCGGSLIQMEHAVLGVNLLSGLVNKGRFLFFFSTRIFQNTLNQSHLVYYRKKLGSLLLRRASE